MTSGTFSVGLLLGFCHDATSQQLVPAVKIGVTQNNQGHMQV